MDDVDKRIQEFIEAFRKLAESGEGINAVYVAVKEDLVDWRAFYLAKDVIVLAKKERDAL